MAGYNPLSNRFIAGILGKRSSTNLQIDALDGLRGAAVVLVLLGHFSHTGLLPVIDLRGAGTIGVYCFFVLSSFLLATPFLRMDLSRLGSSHVWLNYSVRRVLRIYPLYIVILAFFFALSVIGATPRNAALYFDIADLLRHFVLIEAKEYLWTIQVETKFYLILPLIVVCAVLLRRRLWIAVPLIIAIMVLSILMLDGSEPRSSLHLQLPVFLSGTLGALVYLRINEVFADHRLRKYGDLLALAILVVILSFIPSISGFVYAENVDPEILKRPMLFGILWTCFLMSALWCRGVVARILEWDWLRLLGIISFSMYIWHVPILAVIKRVTLLQGLAGMAVAIPSIFVVSLLSYLYIERPFLRIRIAS